MQQAGTTWSTLSRWVGCGVCVLQEHHMLPGYGSLLAAVGVAAGHVCFPVEPTTHQAALCHASRVCVSV